jgi:hypothetical protein
MAVIAQVVFGASFHVGVPTLQSPTVCFIGVLAFLAFDLQLWVWSPAFTTLIAVFFIGTDTTTEALVFHSLNGKFSAQARRVYASHAFIIRIWKHSSFFPYVR